MRVGDMFLILTLHLLITNQFLAVSSERISGPSFTVEPFGKYEFSNSTGILIACSASGQPTPSVVWFLKEGGLVEDIPGLRQMRHDGSLVFPPFSGEVYRADVHATSYRCVASNNVGTVGSRSVSIRAVVPQRYQIRLFDEFVIKGNMAVLRCSLPTFVRDYVTVTSWERNDGFLITPDTLSGKYGILDNGDFFVRDVTDQDRNHSFRCHTENRITKERKTSTNFSKIIVTEPHYTQAPKLIRRSSSVVSVAAGHRTTLSCIAQGYPVPTYRWSRFIDNIRGISSVMGQEDGVLTFRRVTQSDAGKYVCLVSNSAGQEEVESDLIVEGPLRVILRPKEIQVNVGDSVAFNCSVEGSQTNAIVWKKDMKSISSDSRMSWPVPHVFQLRRVQRQDAGMYQCFAQSEGGHEQDSARLIIADVIPKLRKTFMEKTILPGRYVSLSCIASGNPVPQIKWTLDAFWPLASRPNFLVSTYLSDSGDAVSFVNISSVDVSDGGVYACEASNDAGSQSHARRLNVIGPLMVRQLGNVTALSGENFSVICPFYGYPFEIIRWRKEGRLLPFHHRQKVFSNGTLFIEDMVSDIDDGLYSCEVSSGQQVPAVGSFRVTIRTGPKVSAFSFQDNLHEGMRTAVTCIVSAGDPPFAIRWKKDGHPLNDGVLDSKILYAEDGFVSTLTINRLTYQHNGNYTCLASNDVATGSYSSSLTVKVPPRWILEPKDTSAIAGRPALIDCQADGVPQPHIRWKVATGRHPPEQFKTIVSTSNLHILVNGSLNFRNVETTDAGYYMCEASNGVGAVISTVVRLTIHSAPYFETKLQVLNIRRSEKISIECSARGDQPMSISWRKNGAVLDFVTETRYSQNVEEFHGGKKAELVIKKADKKDTALLTCVAINDYGEDSTNTELTVQDIPEAPQNLEVHELSSRSVRLTWNKPFDGNSPILTYTVAWRTIEDSVNGVSEAISPKTISGTDQTLTLRDLRPKTKYFFRVKCENSLGESQYSAEAAATTLDEPPKTAPRQLGAVAVSSRAINVTWTNPVDRNGVGSVDGFYVGYKARGSSLPFTFRPIKYDEKIGEESSSHHCMIYNVKRFTEYIIIVQAYNSRGAGPPSEEIHVRTLEYDPPGVPVIKTFNATSRTIHLSWQMRDSPFSPVAGYVLRYKTDNSEWREAHISGDKSAYILRDLLCGTAYFCYLVAFNSAGKGNESEILTAKTDGNAPIAPEKRGLMTVNSTTAVVLLSSWHDGGCPITSFVVQYKASGQREWTLVSNNIIPQQHNVTISSLTPGSWYSLFMTARNDAGSTDAEYVFGTLTLTGETPPPPSEISDANESVYRHLTITLPVLCSALVLIVVLCVVCFISRRRPGCRPNTPEGADGGETRKPEQMALSVTYDANEEPIYIPTPYAASRVPSYSRKQQCMQASTRQNIDTFGSMRSTYAYDVPCIQRRSEKSEGLYEVPVIYFPSYCHAGLELMAQAIYEVPDRARNSRSSSRISRNSRSWREAGDGSSSTESDNEGLLYTVHSTEECLVKEEARESETECDRLWKTFEGSQYEAVAR